MQRAVAFSLAAALVGCSSIRANVVRTAPPMPSRSGPVAIYVAAQPPPARELGTIEVSGEDREGAVEVLLPAFVEKVAALGGNVAVVDAVDARFEMRVRTTVETYTYPCGFATCTGTRLVPMPEEVSITTMRGRALARDE